MLTVNISRVPGPLWLETSAETKDSSKVAGNFRVEIQSGNYAKSGGFAGINHSLTLLLRESAKNCASAMQTLQQVPECGGGSTGNPLEDAGHMALISKAACDRNVAQGLVTLRELAAG